MRTCKSCAERCGSYGLLALPGDTIRMGIRVLLLGLTRNVVHRIATLETSIELVRSVHCRVTSVCIWQSLAIAPQAIFLLSMNFPVQFRVGWTKKQKSPAYLWVLSAREEVVNALFRLDTRGTESLSLAPSRDFKDNSFPRKNFLDRPWAVAAMQISELYATREE